jgi:bacillithiol biosynthesis cysteine-adding enzyme BshC
MNLTPAQWSALLAQGDSEVARHYAAGPASLAAFARTAPREAIPPLSATEVAEWEAWLAPFGPHRSVTANLRAVAEGRALVVVTGQQAGLFGGPLLTVWKALSAVAWAARLERELGRRVVPVFWVASDDHDFAEVAVARWLARDGSLREHRIAERAEEAGWPVFERALRTEDLSPVLASLAEDVAGDTLEFLHGLPGRDATWESQFVACLLRWIGSTGIVPVAPRLGWMRRRGAGVARRDLEMGAGGARLLAAAAGSLREAGLGSGWIHRAGDEAGFFLMEGRVRAKLRWRNDAVESVHPSTGGVIAARSRAELMGVLEAEPDRFSPNAALRPLVQDLVLPTLAYVGGPAEAVYHAQIGPLYAEHGITRPAFLPRHGGVMMDAPSLRAASGLGLAPGAVATKGPEAIRRAVLDSGEVAARRAAVEARVRATRESIRLLGETVRESADAAETRRSMEKLAERLEWSADRLEAEVRRALLRSETVTARHGRTLTDRLLPGGVAQERHLNWMTPLLACHAGGDVGELLARHVDTSRLEPMAVELERAFDRGLSV